MPLQSCCSSLKAAQERTPKPPGRYYPFGVHNDGSGVQAAPHDALPGNAPQSVTEHRVVGVGYDMSFEDFSLGPLCRRGCGRRANFTKSLDLRIRPRHQNILPKPLTSLD
jgi:hypothetical protein